MRDTWLFICIEQFFKKWVQELLFHSHLEKYAVVSCAGVNKNMFSYLTYLKEQIICLDGDKISWLFGYVIVNHFLLIFHPGLYLGHKAVSWGRTWMGPKRWETCKRDVPSTDSTQLLRVSVGNKKKIVKKDNFWTMKKCHLFNVLVCVNSSLSLKCFCQNYLAFIILIWLIGSPKISTIYVIMVFEIVFSNRSQHVFSKVSVQGNHRV